MDKKRLLVLICFCCCVMMLFAVYSYYRKKIPENYNGTIKEDIIVSKGENTSSNKNDNLLKKKISNTYSRPTDKNNIDKQISSMGKQGQSINSNDPVTSQNLPDATLALLNIEKTELFNNKFEQLTQSEVHNDWKVRISESIENKISKDSHDFLVNTHLIFLYLTTALEEAYLKRSDITPSEYKRNLEALFLWAAEEYQTILSIEEYEKIFSVKPENTGPMIQSIVAQIPEIEIHNQNTTIEEVYKKISQVKIDKLIDLQKQKQINIQDIGEKLQSEFYGEDQALELIKQIHSDYITNSKKILSNEESTLIFGKVDNGE